MKKALLTCTMLLAIVGFSASDAQAQFCLNFVVFCDGIQIDDVANRVINAQWYHYDCAHNATFTTGSKGEARVFNNCPGGNGNGRVQCVNCAGLGDWYFVIDSFDGTVDMHKGQYPGGECWIDELAYRIQLGECTGVQGGGERQQSRNRSSAQ